MTSPKPLALAFSLAACLVATSALADQCNDLDASPSEASEAKAVLADLALEKCLGGADGRPCLDSLDPLCRQLDILTDMTADPDKPETQQQIVDEFVKLAPSLIAVVPPGEDLESRMATEMRQQFLAISGHGEGAAARSRFTPVGLIFFSDSDTEIDLEALLDASCPMSCIDAFRRAIRLYTVASLYRRGLTKLTESSRLQTLDYLDDLDRRWQAYFDSARSQFPWELAVNSWLYKRSPQLAEPPESQWILAHPEPVFEITTEGDSEIEDALSLEAIGFHRWRYEGTELKRPFGASLIATWTGNGGDEIGYGLILHLPRFWSLGATVRDDTVNIVVSTDLAKLVTNGRGLYEKVFE